MADSKIDEVKDYRKLKGKINFVSWKREFERAAKANEILEYLTGEEVVPPKPKKEDYFGKFTRNETPRLTRSMKASQTPTPSSEADEETYNLHSPMPTNSALQWQIEYSEHKTAREAMKVRQSLMTLLTWTIFMSACTSRRRGKFAFRANGQAEIG